MTKAGTFETIKLGPNDENNYSMPYYGGVGMSKVSHYSNWVRHVFILKNILGDYTIITKHGVFPLKSVCKGANLFQYKDQYFHIKVYFKKEDLRVFIDVFYLKNKVFA